MPKPSSGKKNKSKTQSKPDFFKGEFSLPKIEEEVLTFWDERKVFEKSLEENKGATGTKGKTFVFYEGPPYANGKPAIHHVLARVVKDVMLRYKTMRGYYVPRRAGWDTHGLPVEMAAEKALGFKTKKDIERFGVQRFNEEAKKQVWIHKDEWERLTNRIGYWLDLKNAYVTYAPEYIESIWWTLAQISKRGLLYKGHKVVPWCTRCGTALSSHELAQGYKEVVDRSAYVKFKLKNPEKINLPKQNVYILSWTTTPWTLPGNVALAVGPDITYSIVDQQGEKKDEKFIIATALQGEVLGSPLIVDRSITGKELVAAGLEYEPLFDVMPLQKPTAYKIYPADFVTTTEGTGVVHTAVMYGEDDYALGKKVDLPQHHTVDEDGKFTKDVPPLASQYVKSKETEDNIFAYLKAHGTLLLVENYKHEYPFCWRCGTALLYYARTSWFIGMSKLRAELLQRNETIHWMPEHVKEGRFGEWLREVKDWNLSRERYWGAPLPIWECKKCGHTEVVESLKKYDALAGGAKNTYWAMRHGEAENNTLRIADSGLRQFHLTAQGKRQAAASLKLFKKTLEKKKQKIDIIFSSEVLRAKETAALAGEFLGVKIHFDPRLNELGFGPEYDGQPIEKYLNRIPSDEDRLSLKIPGIESFHEVRKRVMDVMKECEVKYKGKNILLVSHGDPIWMLLHASEGSSEKRTLEQRREARDFYPKTGEIKPLDFKNIPRNKDGEVDLHRPFVDEIILRCPTCEAEMKRVPAVADVWYDSGAMPYAQNHFPFAGDAKKPPLFPADYIAEGMDQTRGWFYTLLAIATALGYEAPYRNVITFGLMNDKFGNKMSKSKGNVIEPFEIINKYGVDAIRWYFYAGTPFGEPKNFDELEVGKKLRQVHLIIYNSFVFWKTYAKIATPKKTLKVSKNILDIWILARLSELTDSVTKKLDAYQIREAAFDIESFVDDLSRWYIRRSRKRLQRPDNAVDYVAASETLGFVLGELIKLMAPFTPFLAESLYAAMAGRKESVHLESWPMGGGKAPKKLIDQMKVVRELAALGLAKRAEAKIKVRQPLTSMTIRVKLDKEFQKILADEVNVKKIVFDSKTKDEATLDIAITPELREEGILREVARMVQELRQKAGLEPKDNVSVMLSGSEAVSAAISKYEKNLKSDVGAKDVEYKKSEKFEAEEQGTIDGQSVWIGIRKISK